VLYVRVGIPSDSGESSLWAGKRENEILGDDDISKILQNIREVLEVEMEKDSLQSTDFLIMGWVEYLAQISSMIKV